MSARVSYSGIVQTEGKRLRFAPPTAAFNCEALPQSLNAPTRGEYRLGDKIYLFGKNLQKLQNVQRLIDAVWQISLNVASQGSANLNSGRGSYWHPPFQAR